MDTQGRGPEGGLYTRSQRTFSPVKPLSRVPVLVAEGGKGGPRTFRCAKVAMGIDGADPTLFDDDGHTVADAQTLPGALYGIVRFVPTEDGAPLDLRIPHEALPELRRLLRRLNKQLDEGEYLTARLVAEGGGARKHAAV